MHEIMSQIAMEKHQTSKILFFNTSTLDYLRKKLVKCYIWSIALYSAESSIFKKIELMQIGSFEMWCWKSMKKISWASQVENEEVLHRVKVKRNIIQSYIHKTKEG
jgi:hypothetical protein